MDARHSLAKPIVMAGEPRHFRAQLDALHHGGWTTISADHYLAHLTTGATLPPKPVLVTFDDSQKSPITEGLPQLLARGMTSTLFLMTVVCSATRAGRPPATSSAWPTPA